MYSAVDFNVTQEVIKNILELHSSFCLDGDTDKYSHRDFFEISNKTGHRFEYSLTGALLASNGVVENNGKARIFIAFKKYCRLQKENGKIVISFGQNFTHIHYKLFNNAKFFFEKLIKK